IRPFGNPARRSREMPRSATAMVTIAEDSSSCSRSKTSWRRSRSDEHSVRGHKSSDVVIGKCGSSNTASWRTRRHKHLGNDNGTQAVTIKDVILGLDTFDSEQTIYTTAESPPELRSPAVVDYDHEGRPPAMAQGMRYLLEVWLAREAIAVWSAWRDGREPT